MGSTSAELGLDLKLCAEKSVERFLDESPAAIADEEGRAGKLEECLKGLEEERTKIEAFKRELPLSILLVTDVVKILKQKLEQWRSERDDGDCDVLEEPIPVRSKFEEDERVKLEKDYREKMNWMSSAQLWIDNYRETTNNNSNDSKEKEKAMDEESENSPLESRSRGGRGAFVPFSLSGLAAASSKKEERAAVPLPDLSLSSAGMKASRTAPAMAEELHCGGSTSKEAGRALPYSPAGGHLSLLQAQQQPTKKTRRCWSPELHRRFLLALQQLGGDQVATPKQIRELMKVEGLTNDEVKSHLQKYRLHTRRAPTSSSQNRSVVVVGGLWVPRDRYTASKQSAAQSGSPQGPLQLVGSARAVSVTAGDSFEDDGKSESYSWK